MSVSNTSQKPAGYIFRCSNSTEDYCIQKKLFGEKPRFRHIVERIRKGDTLFLYNVTSGRLHGKFVAASDGKMNIKPEAWDGKFPWQVEVNKVIDHQPVLRKDIEDIISFGGLYDRYPQPELTTSQIEALERIFQQAAALPSEEIEFRNKFPTKHYADDGHKVRSLGELTIDNWLFHHGVLHGYERRLPTGSSRYCDFFVSTNNKDVYVYIELWGLEDKEYQEDKREKIALYRKYNLPLIELTLQDLENLDDILPKRLLRYFTDRTSY